MTLYVFSGVPGAGKSTLSKEIAGLLDCELVSKDTEQIKLFEKFGFQSRDEKLKLVKDAEQIVEKNILRHIVAGSDVVLDKYVRDESFFQEIKKKYSVRIVYIYLYADAQIICARYNNRGIDQRPLCMDVIDRYPYIEGESRVWPPITIEKIREMLSIAIKPSCVDVYEEVDSTNLTLEQEIDLVKTILERARNEKI